MDDKSDAAKVRIFPPVIPLLTILIGIGLQKVWSINLGFSLPSTVLYFLGGGIAMGSLLALGLWSVLLFRKAGQSENPWKPTLHIEER